MGDWDYCCFICAACLFYYHGMLENRLIQSWGEPKDRDEAETAALEVFKEHLDERTLDWLCKFRVIGESPAAQGSRRCYLSGEARVDSYGSAKVKKGNDPIAPGTSPDDETNLSIYYDIQQDTETGALPVHDSCLAVLLQAHAAAQGKKLSPEIKCQPRRIETIETAPLSEDYEEDDSSYQLSSSEDDSMEYESDDWDTVGPELDIEATQERLLRLHAWMEARAAALVPQDKKYLKSLGGLDLDVLYTCLAPKRGLLGTRQLEIDYMELKETPDTQYFQIYRTQQPFVLDPVNVTGLFYYFSELPRLPESSTSASGVEDADDRPLKGDPFSSLSLELLAAIFLELPQESVGPCLESSRTLAKINGYSWFWRQRLQLDMAWLWELFTDEFVGTDRADIDWRTVYWQMHREERNPLTSSFMGLANRRRVWDISQNILELYFERLRIVEAEQPQGIEISEDVLTNAKCRHFPYIATAEVIKSDSSTTWFSITAPDLESTKQFEVHWKEGRLSGMVLKVRSWAARLGAVEDSERVDRISFAKGDWLRGFVLSVKESVVFNPNDGRDKIHNRKLVYSVTGIKVIKLLGEEVTLGEFDGNKRLLIPQAGFGIVGLKSECAEGFLCRLGLLEHSSPGITQPLLLADSALMEYLWKDDVPPIEGGDSGSLKFSKVTTGFWFSGRRMDLIPMERLMLGGSSRGMTSDNSERENPRLGSIIGLAASYNGQIWEVHRFSSEPDPERPKQKLKSVERVGHFSDGMPMKYFPIDGPGGEHIIGVQTIIGSLIHGVRVITNYGRQCVWGKDGANEFRNLTAPPGHFIAGLYCSYDSHSVDEPRMSTMSIISAAGPSDPAPDFDDLQDEAGRNWEPMPPPLDWESAGDVIGTALPKQRLICIDFSRPITNISGLLPAPDWVHVVELGGFTITYADGETLYCGVPLSNWPSYITDREAAAKSLAEMPRRRGMATGSQHIHDDGTPHVESNEEAVLQPWKWDLPHGGQQLSSVTVWANKLLNGIQFHTESGVSSPRWGRCGGTPTATIKIGETSWSVDGTVRKYQVLGVKMFLGSHREPFHTDDARPQAVQALGIRIN